LDVNRFDCGRLWSGHRPERRLYAALFSEYVSFGITMMPGQEHAIGSKASRSKTRIAEPSVGTEAPHRGAVPPALCGETGFSGGTKRRCQVRAPQRDCQAPKRPKAAVKPTFFGKMAN
jgi:hypothetical protein